MAQGWIVINGVFTLAGPETFFPQAQPSAAVEGEVYYDSSVHALKFYNGSSWGNVGGGGTYTSQITWATGLGVITHILGPTDQPLAIASAVAATGSNNLNIKTPDAVTPGAAAGSVNITGGVGVSGAGGSAGGGIVLTCGNTFSASANTFAGPFTITLGSLQSGSPGTSTHGSTFTISAAAHVGSSSGTPSIGGAWNWTGQAGQNTSNTAGTGATGSIWTWASGAGGDASANSGTPTGGLGGSISILTGRGGNATGSGGTRTGGNPGALTIGTGAVGTGASANGTVQPINFQLNGTVYHVLNTTGFTKYANITTAGSGTPPIYASYSTTGNTGAVTNAVNYTPPAAAGRYRLGGIVNVISWTTPASFTVQAAYTDDSGNARTETLGLIRGSTGATATAITAVDRWYFEIPVFAINNAGVAITLSTTGTFTGSPSYNLSGVLEQLA